MVTVREYSNETFSAEGAARHYFASYNESEIDRKQKDMASVPPRTVENQQGFSSQNKKEASWFLKAPQDLSRCIVEQQYSNAVAVVIRTRAYVESMGDIHNKYSVAENAQALDILKEINQKSNLLANTIKKSLLNLPNSPLWGANEQQKRLKLLIALGKFNMAAAGFSQSQVLAIRKVLKASSESSSGSGDVFNVVTDLSVAFFQSLLQATRCFFELFNEHTDKPNIITLLLSWVQSQVGAYVEVLTRQLQLGTNECAALVILQLREISTRSNEPNKPSRRYSNFGNSTAYLPPSDGRNQNKGIAMIGAQDHLAITSEDSLSPNDIKKKEKVEVGRGALWFLSRCLGIVFSEAKKMMTVSSACGDMVSWILLPEVDRMLSAYADEFVKEIQNQVSQDSWNPVSAAVTAVSISSPISFHWSSSLSSSQKQTTATDGAVNVACSFDWLVSALNHFIGEVCILMQISDKTDSILDSDANNHNTASTGRATPINPFSSQKSFQSPIASIVTQSKAQALAAGLNSSSSERNVDTLSYSRSDVCEIESGAIAAILRILLRYVIEVESTDTKGFSRMQLTTYINTLEVISLRLIPSLQAFMDSYLVDSKTTYSSQQERRKSSRSYSISNAAAMAVHSSNELQAKSPQAVFSALQVKVAQLIQEKSNQQRC